MLTSEQIESLFTFCKKHFVYYYDVQIELVDHLANAVETELLKDPKITFDKALEKVHQSFGIMGFAPLVAEKRKMVEQQGRRLFWKLFKKHFGWPKILLFLLIASFGFTLFSIRPYLFQIFNISVVITLCILVAIVSITRRKKISVTGKRFLVAEFSQGSNLIWVSYYCMISPNIFDNYFLRTAHGIFSILFSSIVIGILCITAMVHLQVLNSLNNKLQKDYPEVFAKV